MLQLAGFLPFVVSFFQNPEKTIFRLSRKKQQ